MVFVAKVENLEIRGREIREGKAGKYALVRFDSVTGDRLEFVDRNEDRFDFYERGRTCDIYLKVTDTARYTNFVITEMRYRDSEVK